MTRTAGKRLALTCFALSLAWSAQAQGVWRCGGNVYGDTPCPGGRAVEAADARSGAELQAAREIAQREAQTLQRLLAERRAREAEALATTVYYGARREGLRPAPRAATGPALSPRSVSVSPPKLQQVQQPAESPEEGAAACACRRSYFASSCCGVSRCAGLTGMQATGQSCTHCGSSKWPTHSVHLPGSIW
jgi:hypothetical protein